jgi:hypothetical protein
LAQILVTGNLIALYKLNMADRKRVEALGETPGLCSVNLGVCPSVDLQAVSALARSVECDGEVYPFTAQHGEAGSLHPFTTSALKFSLGEQIRDSQY